MTHTYNDNYQLKNWTQKPFENNAPVKTDILAYIIMGVIILVGLIAIFFLEDSIIKNHVQIGIFTLATLSMLLLFLVKMVRNRQIDWYLIGLLVVLCLVLYSSCQRLEMAQESAQLLGMY